LNLLRLVLALEEAGSLHAAAVQLELSPFTVRAGLLDPPFPMPEMQQSMQWHKYRSHDPAIVWLRNLFHEAADKMNSLQP
jgi:DNA-binding transcriptional LysR family regulator